ncbi:MAG TPA: DNA-3-methyladenine glycosylase [Betaproteobacteria bacterium]|nr:DNA-3-methyladenine glycosylase [Betaproteobacteria bacterium]
MTPDYWPQATTELAAADPMLRRLIQQYRHTGLRSRGDPFSTLVRSIVGQQISVKAADSVWRKLAAAVPKIAPQPLYEATPETLQGCGLSRRKIEYLQDLARHFLDGALQPARWGALDDETVIQELTGVRGVGRWTAEMFLIFSLLRPNILPLDDIGLQRAMSNHYSAGQPISKLKIREIAECWQPWRSVATWYLWRSLDPLPVEY